MYGHKRPYHKQKNNKTIKKMKYVKSYNSEAVITYFGKRQFCRIVTDEYATIWEITGKIDGHEFPFFSGRYKKSQYKNNLQAISAYIAEVENKYK